MGFPYSHGGTPIAGLFMIENSIKMDDDWRYPYSGNLHIGYASVELSILVLR